MSRRSSTATTTPRQPWSPELRERLADELETEGLEPLVARLRARGSGRGRGDRPAQPATRAAGARARGGRRRRSPAVQRLRRAGRARRPGPAASGPLPTDRRAGARALRWRPARRGAAAASGGLRPRAAADDRARLRRGRRHLAGEWSLDEAVAVTARRTRQYAKRQLTWFRRDPRVTWIPLATGPRTPTRSWVGPSALLRAALS